MRKQTIPDCVNNVATLVVSGLGLTYAGTFVHEIGHAIAVKLVGWEVKSIKIYMNGSGCCVSKISGLNFRKRMLVEVSGPLLGSTYYGAYFSTQNRLRSGLFDSVMCYLLFSNIINVIPCKKFTDGRRIWTYLFAHLGIKPRRYCLSYSKVFLFECLVLFLCFRGFVKNLSK